LYIIEIFLTYGYVIMDSQHTCGKCDTHKRVQNNHWCRHSVLHHFNNYINMFMIGLLKKTSAESKRFV